MHINIPDTTTLLALEELVNKTPFLKLKNSKQVYPHSLGTGLPLLLVDTPICSAVISLQGAHLLEFKTQNGDPLLWVSPNCDFTPGSALRGGVPICVPWFGGDPANPNKPKHGFVRNQFWQLGNAQLLANGSAELEFLFQSDATEWFPHDFSCELRMILGDSVKMEITINNTDTEDFNCAWAFHNYYRISSLQDVRVLGLDQHFYFDNIANNIQKQQVGELAFTAPTDRVFLNVVPEVSIKGSPSIHISHHNAPSVVVWNPGSEAAAKVADIGEGQEQFYICVERGAVRDNQWCLKAGTSQKAWVEFKQSY
jgi:glucose-6-phosphate 1-epimerase